MLLLKSSSNAGSLCGTIYEDFAHDVLSAVGKLELKLLVHKKSRKAETSLQIELNRSNYEYEKLDETISPQNGPYHVPSARNFTSIDLFYCPTEERSIKAAHAAFKGGSKLLIFSQMIVSKRHPLKGNGIILVLEKLQQLEFVNANPQRVLLIFIVPEKTGQKFPLQSISMSYGKWTDVAGVGRKRSNTLTKRLGRKVDMTAFSQALENEQISSEAFGRIDNTHKLKENVLRSIPQYVCEVYRRYSDIFTMPMLPKLADYLFIYYTIH